MKTREAILTHPTSPAQAAATAPRELRGEADREQLERLLDAAFEVPRGSRFMDDFPVWDERLGPAAPEAARLGIFDGASLVSSACARLAQAQARDARGDRRAFPVALIGGVATDPASRGRGLATRAVGAAVEWARARGAVVALLWGSEHELYRRLGFELCGVQQAAPLESLALPEPGGAGAGGRGWAPGIFAQLRARGTGIALQAGDLRWMEAHRGVDWFWSGSRDAVSAYAGVGRGIDLQGYVHEWGGEAGALRALLARVREAHPGALLLGAPELFDAAGIGPSHALAALPAEYLCMARVLDPAALFAARWGAASARLEARVSAQGRWWLEGPGFGFDDLTSSELARLMLGPEGAPSESVAARYFPIPLWVWGLDAV